MASAAPYIEQEQAISASQQERQWLGENGEPLPFRCDADIKDFLLTADIVKIEPIHIGITKPELLTLEKDGVRAHAAFRSFEQFYERSHLGDGRYVLNFRDSFRFEPAAYELAGLLGMRNVPPAVRRTVGERRGSLQIWVYSTLMDSDRAEQGLTPPNKIRWVRQRQQIILFDALIGNTDRNAGNLLIDRDWKIWLIDHSRAFYRRADYQRLDRVVYVERTFWERLRQLDREQLDAALRDHLSRAQIRLILERREHLVEFIEGLIAERGEEAVLYEPEAA